METLNLNALRVFAAAGRHGSFQMAAAALNITHGAVSQRIKQLEAELGVILFDRHPRGVALTAKGAAYHAAVEQALAALGAATAEVRGAGAQVTLHAGASTIAKWLMPRMGAFNRRFPGVTLVTEVHDTLLTRNLGRNELALWPSRGPVANPAHHVRCLGEVQLAAVCSPDFMRPDWPVDLDTLLSLPLLQDAHRRWERLIEETGHKGASILNMGRSALALDAAVQGHGVAIAPSFMIEGDVRARRLVEVWRSPVASGEFYYLSWPRDGAQARPLRQVVAWLLSEFGAGGQP